MVYRIHIAEAVAAENTEISPATQYAQLYS